MKDAAEGALVPVEALVEVVVLVMDAAETALLVMEVWV